MRSFKVGVKTSGDVNWSYNGLRFGDRGSAEVYGSDLAGRWTAVEAYEVHESEDEPNK